MTWPHLLAIEFLAAAMISIFLLLMGLFVNAPLEDLANGERHPGGGQGARGTSSACRSCWPYFHPTVAGVLVPTFVLVGRGPDPVRRPRAT